MTTPTHEPSELTPERRSPEDARPRQSVPEFERDEQWSAQMGEDPGTVEPEPD